MNDGEHMRINSFFMCVPWTIPSGLETVPFDLIHLHRKTFANSQKDDLN